MSFTYGFSLHVTVYVNPAYIDSFFAAFNPVFKKALCEPECAFFGVYHNPKERGKISWVEDWKQSPEWFLQNQITKSYYREYLAITESMFTKQGEYQFLERVGPDYVMVNGALLPQWRT
ncbi:hypothetical protein F5X98DRAFT_376228 [Xylaria grammica]|nr:hypothetical protein F5X98DRAFT_376228 [Xylaria grammica]